MTPAEADEIVERLMAALATTLVELEEAGGDWSSWTTGFDSGMRVALERPALAQELVEAMAIKTFTEGDDPSTMAVLHAFRNSRPSVAALDAGILYLQAIARIEDPGLRRLRADEVGRELGMVGKVFDGFAEIVDRLRREGVL